MSRAGAAWIVIVAAGAGTYLIRTGFLVFADRVAAVPPVLREALRMIPAAVLTALVTPALFRRGGTFDPWNPFMIAGLLAFAVAWRTKNLFATIAVGLVAATLLLRVDIF